MENSERPWYRERMVWMLVAIPSSAVLMGVVLITLAITSWDGLVVDDYYKQGKEINRVLVRDRFASEHQVYARLEWQVVNQRVSVDLRSSDAEVSAASLTLNLLHPTRMGNDYTAELARGPDGRFHGVLPNVSEGPWLVHLETSDWRLTTRVTVTSNAMVAVELKPLPVVSE